TLKPGDQVIGVVVGVMPFGVFVELAPDCSALIHVSRLSENYVEDLHEAVQVGDVITGWVTGTDEKRRRVALSAISPERAAELDAQRQQSRGGFRGGRGGGNQRDGNRSESSDGGGRSSDNRGGDNRGRGGQGSRGQGARGRGTGAAGGRGGQQGGRSGDGRQKGGGRGRQQGGRENRRSRDRKPEVYRVTGGGPDKAPITDAMKTGEEPLRSFGDLAQFYKDDKPDPPKPAPPSSTEAQASAPDTDATSTAEATPDAAEKERGSAAAEVASETDAQSTSPPSQPVADPGATPDTRNKDDNTEPPTS
ncbi:MAG: S1 RNA-binding domain-containing protein, partial [Planctomycetota bacterium]